MLSKIFLFLISVVVLVLIFPKEGRFKYEYTRGKPWMHSDLIAPFDFAILKSDQELASEREAVLADLKPYYRFDDSLTARQQQNLISVFNQKWEKKYRKTNDQEKRRLRHLERCLTIYDSVMAEGVLDFNPESIPGWSGKINLIHKNSVRIVRPESLMSLQEAGQRLLKDMDGRADMDENLMLAALESVLVPNVVEDLETFEKEKRLLLNRISVTRGMVQDGEMIIGKGEVVSAELYQVLESLRIDYESKLGSSFKYVGILSGQIILMAVSMVSLFLFLYFFRVEIFSETKQIVLLLMLILFMVFVTSLVVKYAPGYVYLVPVCLIPIIVGVFMDSRLALFTHLITIIITGFLVPNSYEYVFLQLFAGIVTVLSTVKLERRSQFFFTSLMIFLIYSIIYTGMTLIKEGSLQDINYTYFALFGGSALLTLFSQPFIYIFEKAFGLITNVTLLELSNTNNKLLRELALKAPGTFQHSMQMANLAEEAIHEIGGNPLLVRTGAMYHDIGKISDPQYFVENQSTGVNPHDELTYDESAEIIVDHVLGGVEKARRHNLPEQIIDFIRTHHGTRKADYFYTLAKKDNPEEEVDEERYTYPGPEPFSKETAVLMMADAVEAASRSLKKPDEESIDKLVENLIDKQIESRQFDNADITLRDIKKIKNIFKKKLMNIYHLRIEYPE
jgi:hypothetical protein